MRSNIKYLESIAMKDPYQYPPFRNIYRWHREPYMQDIIAFIADTLEQRNKPESTKNTTYSLAFENLFYFYGIFNSVTPLLGISNFISDLTNENLRFVFGSITGKVYKDVDIDKLFPGALLCHEFSFKSREHDEELSFVTPKQVAEFIKRIQRYVNTFDDIRKKDPNIEGFENAIYNVLTQKVEY